MYRVIGWSFCVDIGETCIILKRRNKQSTFSQGRGGVGRRGGEVDLQRQLAPRAL